MICFSMKGVYIRERYIYIERERERENVKENYLSHIRVITRVHIT